MKRSHHLRDIRFRRQRIDSGQFLFDRSHSIGIQLRAIQSHRIQSADLPGDTTRLMGRSAKFLDQYPELLLVIL